MNQINFTGRNNFPLSVETMTFLQNMIGITGTLTLLGGDTYILSGCETTDLSVSSGYVVIDGEILPFTGGALQEYVYIKETKRAVNAQGYTFNDVYNTRTVEFGYNDTRYKWEDFKRVSTNTELAEAIANINTTIKGLQSTPKGIITMWSGSISDIPEGWVLCAGQESWIPNLSGRFIVGYSSADEDYNQIGKKAGFKEVALNEDNIAPHKHIVPWGDRSGDYQPPWGLAEGYIDNQIGAARNDNDNSWGYSSPVGKGLPHENRPPYYVLAYIIKL